LISDHYISHDLSVVEYIASRVAVMVGVEETFITWFDVDTNGSTAVIHGRRHDLHLVIESPEGLSFSVEKLEEQSKLNAKPGILKRISVTLPVASEAQIRVRMETV
jgi:hypothetical protein